MNYPLAILLLIVGGIIWIMQKRGRFVRLVWFRHLPKFFVANGIGFLIPLHFYADGLAIFLIWLVWSEWRHYRKNSGAP